MTRLKHYGVKGMRWGVRRSEEELADAGGEGEGAGGGGFEEELEEVLDGFQEFAENVIDEVSDIKLNVLKGFKDFTDKGKEKVDKFLNAKRLIPGKINKELHTSDYKNNPKAQKELLRYVEVKSRLHRQYKNDRISKAEYKQRTKDNDKIMKRNAREAKKAMNSKTTVFVDTVKEVRYSIKGNAGLNSHVAGSSNR